jgi:hypothetical protein
MRKVGRNISVLSVLSGTLLCRFLRFSDAGTSHTRAMSFWEYQSRQERCESSFEISRGFLIHIRCFSAFQQAVLKSVNDKSAQYQKQLESVVREGQLFRIDSNFIGDTK